MDDNLKGRKKNRVLLQIFKDLKIYFEVTQIQGKRLLFIYNDSIGLKWSRLNTVGVRTTSVTSWLQHDTFLLSNVREDLSHPELLAQGACDGGLISNMRSNAETFPPCPLSGRQWGFCGVSHHLREAP